MASRSWVVASFLAQRWSAIESSISRRGVVIEFCSKRGCSGKSGSSVEDTDGEESEAKRIRAQIEQALYEIQIHSAAPVWLPLFPGGSFWVHPDQITTKKQPKKKPGPLLEPANDREVLAMVMPMGWPSSSAASDALKPGAGTKY